MSFQQHGNVPYGTWVSPSRIYKYNAGSAPTEMDEAVIFIGTANINSSGIATFEMTLNGISTGTAIFSNIYAVNATAELNTSTLTSVPIASDKVVTSGKTLTVNVVESIGILVGSQGLEFSTNTGIKVNVIVIGN